MYTIQNSSIGTAIAVIYLTVPNKKKNTSDFIHHNIPTSTLVYYNFQL